MPRSDTPAHRGAAASKGTLMRRARFRVLRLGRRCVSGSDFGAKRSRADPGQIRARLPNAPPRQESEPETLRPVQAALWAHSTPDVCTSSARRPPRRAPHGHLKMRRLSSHSAVALAGLQRCCALLFWSRTSLWAPPETNTPRESYSALGRAAVHGVLLPSARAAHRWRHSIGRSLKTVRTRMRTGRRYGR